MYGIISSHTFTQDILNSIESEPIFLEVGQFQEDEFVNLCKSAARVEISTFIVEMECVIDEISIVKGIRALKMARPKVRIILIAVDYTPGNKVISDVIGLGCYDIIAPSLPSDEESEKETIFFDLTPFIVDQLKLNSTYADVARWHLVNEEQVIPTKKREQIFKNKNDKKERELIQISSTIISVVNLSPSAGSSLISVLLSELIEKYSDLSVTVHESPIVKPYLADYSGLIFELEEKHTEFSSSITNILNGKSAYIDIPFFKNVYWNVLDPQTNHESKNYFSQWDKSNTLDLLLTTNKSNVNIFDLGNSFNHESLSRILDVSKMIIVVIDPHPTKISQNENNLKYFIELYELNKPIYFLINKWDEVIPKNEFVSGLGIKPNMYVNYIEPGYIYKSLYKFKKLLSFDEVEIEMIDNFSMLLKEIIPRQIFEEYTKKKSNTISTFVTNFFKK